MKVIYLIKCFYAAQGAIYAPELPPGWDSGSGAHILLSFCLWPRAFRILLPSPPYWFLLRARLNELLIFVQEFLSLAPRKLDYDRFQIGSHLWWLISCVNLTGLRDTQEATGLTSGWVCRVCVNHGSVWIGRLGNDGPHQREWASLVSWRLSRTRKISSALLGLGPSDLQGDLQHQLPDPILWFLGSNGGLLPLLPWFSGLNWITPLAFLVLPSLQTADPATSWSP